MRPTASKDAHGVFRPFFPWSGRSNSGGFAAAGRRQSGGRRRIGCGRSRPRRGLPPRPGHAPRRSRGHSRSTQERLAILHPSSGNDPLLHAGALLPVRPRQAHAALHRRDHRRGRRARRVRLQRPQSAGLWARRRAAPRSGPSGGRRTRGPLRLRPRRLLLRIDPRETTLHPSQMGTEPGRPHRLPRRNLEVDHERGRPRRGP